MLGIADLLTVRLEWEEVRDSVEIAVSSEPLGQNLVREGFDVTQEYSIFVYRTTPKFGPLASGQPSENVPKNISDLKGIYKSGSIPLAPSLDLASPEMYREFVNSDKTDKSGILCDRCTQQEECLKTKKQVDLDIKGKACLDVHGACRYLDCSTNTLNRLIWDGEIKPFYIRSTRRFLIKHLDRYIRTQMKKIKS